MKNCFTRSFLDARPGFVTEQFKQRSLRALVRPSAAVDDVLRLESLIRQKYSLDQHELVFVWHGTPYELGFPPVETNIVFFKKQRRYRLRVFKQIVDVSETDVPIAWLLPSLEDFGDRDCC